MTPAQWMTFIERFGVAITVAFAEGAVIWWLLQYITKHTVPLVVYTALLEKLGVIEDVKGHTAEILTILKMKGGK